MSFYSAVKAECVLLSALTVFCPHAFLEVRPWAILYCHTPTPLAPPPSIGMSLSQVICFYLRFAGNSGVSLSPGGAQLVEAGLVWSVGTPALTGDYLVDMSSDNDTFSVPEIFVSDGLQNIPLAGCCELAPRDILRVTSAPLLHVRMTDASGLPQAYRAGASVSTYAAAGPRRPRWRLSVLRSRPPPFFRLSLAADSVAGSVRPQST